MSWARADNTQTLAIASTVLWASECVTKWTRGRHPRPERSNKSKQHGLFAFQNLTSLSAQLREVGPINFSHRLCLSGTAWPWPQHLSGWHTGCNFPRRMELPPTDSENSSHPCCPPAHLWSLLYASPSIFLASHPIPFLGCDSPAAECHLSSNVCDM